MNMKQEIIKHIKLTQDKILQQATTIQHLTSKGCSYPIVAWLLF